MTFRFYWVMLVCLFSLPAFAGSTDEARQHYQSATAHFAVGEFADAAVEYQAAFKAKPDPALLYNAAQSYRLANNLEKALILYRNYVQLYPGEVNIAEVRAQIDKLKVAIAAADQAKTAPPTGTNEPTHIKREPTSGETAGQGTTESAQPSSPSQAALSPESVHSDNQSHATPLYKKWWLWTVVGGVVAGGVVAAVVLSTTSTGSWSTAPDIGPGSRNGLTITAVRW